MRTKTKDCRYGTFTFYENDEFVGRSLDLYGDFSEDENSAFRMILRPGDVVIEVGANIGAFTVPLARMVGDTGAVYAFEPQPENYRLLVRNADDNRVRVYAAPYAVGASGGVTKIPRLADLGHFNFGAATIGDTGSEITQVTLDDYLSKATSKIKLIKLDCEGSELAVLQGAEALIARDRPFIYCENDRKEKSAALIGWLLDHGYRCYWHRSPLFIRQNFRNNQKNVFGSIVSLNMFCAPEESGAEVNRLEEVADCRTDDQMYEREYTRYMKRVVKDPGSTEARWMAAHYASLKGEPALARKLIDENLAIDPHHVATRAIQGFLDLQEGKYVSGWKQYELRYLQAGREGFGFRHHPEPPWDGKPTTERVLIWAEQGFGDTIMFCRFARRVLERAPNAIFEVPAQLFELIEISGLIPKGQLYRVGRLLPAYSYHCSLPSLPATLELNSETDFRATLTGDAAYLHADRKMVQSWLKRDVPRIGVCLKGGVASERAYSRDMPVEAIEDKVLKPFGPFMTLEQHGQWESYADTAAAVSSLDLVLTVDTSVAHLAGALGVETWLMLSSDPDWRWGLGRSDSPWYPSMRIFRQRKYMDWSSVVDEVRGALEARGMTAAA